MSESEGSQLISEDEEVEVQNIKISDLVDEMKDNYLIYADYVIRDRALPDIRDGLKPVHRRILWSMWSMGCRQGSNYKKSAKIIGECMGNYHPHGDQSIYGAMVRLAQPFVHHNVLIDGKGNFGNVDGDPAAAMRYCVTGDTLIRTDDGTFKISELCDSKINSDNDIDINILSDKKVINHASKFFNSGYHDTYELKTKNGYSIKGSSNHPIYILTTDDNGKPVKKWKLLSEITKNDYVIIDKTVLNDNMPCNIDLAVVLGCLISEGSITGKRMTFNNTDKSYFDDFIRSFNNITNGNVKYYTNDRELESGKIIYEFDVQNITNLRNYDWYNEIEGLYAKDKFIPSCIWKSSLLTKMAFMKYLFHGDGSVSSLPKNSIMVSYSTYSEQLSIDVQIMLLEFGIVSNKSKSDKEYKVYISNKRSSELFKDNIGFLYDKNDKLIIILTNIDNSRGNGNKQGLSKDVIPFLSSYIKNRNKSTWLRDNNIDSYDRLERNRFEILSNIKDIEDRKIIEEFISDGYYFSKVKSCNETLEKELVYSIKVDSDCHSFVANGFINHNTEARLSKFTEAVYFADINEGTIDFIDNYAGDEKEPVILPSRIPMTLITSITGIAVGMATDIPPHNLDEVCDATIAYINDINITYEDLCKIITGPDVPLGGYLKADDYEYIYKYGGTFKWRTDYAYETDGKNKSIIIRSIPIQSCKSDIIIEIAKGVHDEKISGIIDVRDESSKEGMRIVVELAPKADYTSVLNSLYKETRLQTSIKYNSVAIVENQPLKVGLKDVFENFLKFRRVVITRRTECRKNKYETRKEIVDGILKATDNIDKVIEIVKAGTDADKTINKLKSFFSLTQKQAEHVFNMPIRRLSKMDTTKLVEEEKELNDKLKIQYDILGDPIKIDEIIKKEILDIRNEFGHARNMTIIEDFDSITPKSVIKEEDIALIFLDDGTVKSTPVSNYRLQKRRGSGFSGVNSQDSFPVYVTQSSTHDDVLVFTDKGNRYRLSVYSIPASDRIRKPSPLSDFIPEFNPEYEKVVAVTKSEFEDNECLVMIGTKGKIRKLENWVVTSSRDSTTKFYPVELGGDVVSTIIADINDKIIIVTKKGKILHTSLEYVTNMKTRNSAGIIGMNIFEDDEIISVSVANDESYVLTISKNGLGKRTPIEEFSIKGRGRCGVAGMNLSEDDTLVFGQAVNPESESSLFVMTNENNAIRMKFEDVSEQGRITRGTIIKKMKENEFISTVSVE